MKVFVTGATGFVGAAIVRELLANGHEVLGLVRSDDGVRKLQAAGAEALRGDLRDIQSLQDGTGLCEAVIHAGFVHDFSRFAEACAIDHSAIEAMGAAVSGSRKPLVVTAGLAFVPTIGAVTVETDQPAPPSDLYPRASEAVAQTLAARGVAASTVRLPPSVHGRGDHGFVPMLIDIARQKGRAAYVGSGDNIWPAVHVDDAASAYHLAVERATPAATYHAVGEQGVPFRAIAETIARGLGVPCVSLTDDEARDYFGWFYGFASMHQPASSDHTREYLGWLPKGPDLLADMVGAGYFVD